METEFPFFIKRLWCVNVDSVKAYLPVCLRGRGRMVRGGGGWGEWRGGGRVKCGCREFKCIRPKKADLRLNKIMFAYRIEAYHLCCTKSIMKNKLFKDKVKL